MIGRGSKRSEKDFFDHIGVNKVERGFLCLEEGFNATEGVQCIGRGFLEAK